MIEATQYLETIVYVYAGIIVVSLCTFAIIEYAWGEARLLVPIGVHTVPTLSVVLTGEAKNLKEGTGGQIFQGYREAAEDFGVKVTVSRRATLTVTSYQCRGLGFSSARIPFAFLRIDELRGRIAYEGQEKEVRYRRKSFFSFGHRETLAIGFGCAALNVLVN